MKTALVIMAAGIGSRFGTGIKQLEPVGAGNEIIMDYSIHDAIQAGFDKIIVIIRKDIEADFQERVGNRVAEVCRQNGVELCYAFQSPENIPQGFSIPEGRTKPWGTGHAVLAAKDLIKEPFAVINADDYYGKECYQKIHDYLVHPHQAISMAGFILKNTLSENGGVTRGVCKLNGTRLSSISETHNIIKTAQGAEADGNILDSESMVSMNMWGFPAREGEVPDYLNMLEQGFIEFLKHDLPGNPLKAEYLLPIHIGGLLKEHKLEVEVLPTSDTWFGVTYQEDKPFVVESFQKLIQKGIYKEDLYSDL